MKKQTHDRVTDVYWYEIIKNILFDSKQYLFTIEIWEKMRDNYGYSYDKDRVEKELLNLQRSGYAVSVDKRGKQAWTFPSEKKLLQLIENKKIDSAIAEFINTRSRIPTIKELIAKIDEPVTQQFISERLEKISKLTKSIDEIIRQSCEQNLRKTEKEKNREQWKESTCTLDVQEMSFYETVIDKLDGIIEDIDILTTINIIDALKRKLNIHL
jgi:arsenate reductase-like glutaredoxin family protein